MKPGARATLRWLLLAVLLALAVLVALDPRWSSTADPTGGPQPAVRSPELDQLRAAAALQPCPAPAATAAPSGPLSGIVLPCLGAPGTVDLGAALAGRPALLNLWGPLCRPCAEELPALAGYAAEPGAVPVIGVEVQRLPEGALQMLAALDVHYPSVSDPEGRLSAALHAPQVLPLSFVVAADGRVSQVNPPRVLRSPAQVRAVVAHYLGPGAVG
ncbi:MAG TPA: TlpA disulfide reductase family protein [Pseudonocardiaceae bacterium]|nr:TlpA disulfide reductase family protein [Pseudonocardiaceae bacterium]